MSTDWYNVCVKHTLANCVFKLHGQSIYKLNKIGIMEKAIYDHQKPGCSLKGSSVLTEN